VIDALKGDPLCSVSAPHSVSELAFTPDGKRVVGASGNVVCTWDLAAGEFGGDIGLPNQIAGITPTLDSRFVMVGGKDLFDLDRKLVVWEYAGGTTSFAGHGGRTFNAIQSRENARDRRIVLVVAALPHAAAKKADDAIQPGKGLALQPGGSVSVNVTVEGTPEQQQRIGAALAEQLKLAGIGVDPASPVKLFARTEAGKTRTQTYQVRKFGDFNTSTETVSSTEKITRVGFEVNGKVAWETSSVTGGWLPMMITTQGGKSLQQAVSDQSKYSSSWLESATLPTYVPMPSEKPWAGASHWTMKGIADDRAADIPPAGFVPKPRAAIAPGGKSDGLD
jgi:hypothetical protein